MLGSLATLLVGLVGEMVHLVDLGIQVIVQSCPQS